MTCFETIDDVEEWLAPLGYDAFWEAIAPLGLFGPEDRAHCDRTLQNGIADMETVMSVMKAMVRWELTLKHDWPIRTDACPTPKLELVE